MNLSFYTVIFIILILLSKVKNNLAFKKHWIHDESIPRFGGLVFIIFFIIFFYDYSNYLYLFILFSIFIIGSIEDIYQCLSSKLRLYLIVFLSLLFSIFVTRINGIEVFFAYDFFNSSIFLIFLTTLALSSITNAFNLIDGLNGLAILNTLAICIALLTVSYLNNSYYFIYLFENLILVLFITFIFNFPRANIYIGDGGSYLLGFFISSIIIIFFNDHNFLLSWSALSLLIFPITETIFTTFRRIKKRISPFSPDNEHFHHLIYNFLSYLLKDKKWYINPLATMMLFPFYVSGPIAFIFYWNDIFATLVFILFFTIFYIFFSNFLRIKLKSYMN